MVEYFVGYWLILVFPQWNVGNQQRMYSAIEHVVLWTNGVGDILFSDKPYWLVFLDSWTNKNQWILKQQFLWGYGYSRPNKNWLVVWNIVFFHILGISSSQLTNSIIFRVGLNHQPVYVLSSGKRTFTQRTGKSIHFSWVNPRTKPPIQRRIRKN